MGQAESKDSETRPPTQHPVRKSDHGGERSLRTTPPLTSAGPPSSAAPATSRALPASRYRGRPVTTPKTFPKARPLPGAGPRLTPTAQQPQASPNLRTRPRLKQQFAVRAKPSPEVPEKAEPPQTPVKTVPVATRSAKATPVTLNKPAKSKPVPIKKPAKENRQRERPQTLRTSPARANPRATSDDSDEKSPPAKRMTRRSARKTDASEPPPPSPMSLENNDPKVAPPQIGEIRSSGAEEKMLASSSSDCTSDETGSDDDELDVKLEASSKPDNEQSYLPEEDDDKAEDSSDSDQSEQKASVPAAASARARSRRSEPPASKTIAEQQPFQLRRSRRRSVPVRRLQIDPCHPVYVSV